MLGAHLTMEGHCQRKFHAPARAAVSVVAVIEADDVVGNVVLRFSNGGVLALPKFHSILFGKKRSTMSSCYPSCSRCKRSHARPADFGRTLHTCCPNPNELGRPSLLIAMFRASQTSVAVCWRYGPANDPTRVDVQYIGRVQPSGTGADLPYVQLPLTHVGGRRQVMLTARRMNLRFQTLVV